MSTIEPSEIDPPTAIASTSEVWPPPPVNQPVPKALRAIPELRQQNVFLLILLYVGTLGFYSIFWMRRQILTVNAMAGERIIPTAAIWVVVGLHLMAFGYGVAESLVTLSRDSGMLMRLVFNIGMLTIFFMVRSGLNRVMGVREGDRGFSGKFGTFFLNMFYMQHKINVYLKNQPIL